MSRTVKRLNGTLTDNPGLDAMAAALPASG
jgi:hypothetical protein